MARCKHKKVSIIETIEAYHQRNFDGNEYFCNNEYGNRIRITAECMHCYTHRVITRENIHKMPKWITDRIEAMKTNDDWFIIN